jgi:hypothetical protein
MPAENEETKDPVVKRFGQGAEETIWTGFVDRDGKEYRIQVRGNEIYVNGARMHSDKDGPCEYAEDCTGSNQNCSREAHNLDSPDPKRRCSYYNDRKLDEEEQRTTTLAELAFAATGEPSMGFAQYAGKVWLAVFDDDHADNHHATLWGIDQPERERVDSYVRTFPAYAVSLETLQDPAVTLEDIKKHKIDAGKLKVAKDVRAAVKADGWVIDKETREMILLCEYLSDTYMTYLYGREDPKGFIASILTSAHTNKEEPNKEKQERVEWLKRYMEAQKIPFKIEEQFNKEFPHLDKVVVI